MTGPRMGSQAQLGGGAGGCAPPCLRVLCLIGTHAGQWTEAHSNGPYLGG